jgi:hypothetical protein
MAILSDNCGEMHAGNYFVWRWQAIKKAIHHSNDFCGRALAPSQRI